MNELIKRIPWKKVAKIGACAVSAGVAFADASKEMKQKEMLAELAKRVAELEGKKS